MTVRRWAQRAPWAQHLPVLIALLFTTIAVTGPAEPTHRQDTTQTIHTGRAVLAAPLVPELLAKAGVLLVKRGGSATAAPEAASATRAAAASLAPPALWWMARTAAEHQHPGRYRETFQGRAPPGTR